MEERQETRAAEQKPEKATCVCVCGGRATEAEYRRARERECVSVCVYEAERTVERHMSHEI
jgi:hypothetical protein